MKYRSCDRRSDNVEEVKDPREVSGVGVVRETVNSRGNLVSVEAFSANIACEDAFLKGEELSFDFEIDLPNKCVTLQDKFKEFASKQGLEIFQMDSHLSHYFGPEVPQTLHARPVTTSPTTSATKEFSEPSIETSAKLGNDFSQASTQKIDLSDIPRLPEARVLVQESATSAPGCTM